MNGCGRSQHRECRARESAQCVHGCTPPAANCREAFTSTVKNSLWCARDCVPPVKGTGIAFVAASRRPLRDQFPLTGVKPVPGASVVVRQGSRTEASGSADSSGLYRVRLDSGTYDVRVSQQGYAPAQLSIRLGTSDVTQQVVLRKERRR